MRAGVYINGIEFDVSGADEVASHQVLIKDVEQHETETEFAARVFHFLKSVRGRGICLTFNTGDELSYLAVSLIVEKINVSVEEIYLKEIDFKSTVFEIAGVLPQLRVEIARCILQKKIKINVSDSALWGAGSGDCLESQLNQANVFLQSRYSVFYSPGVQHHGVGEQYTVIPDL